MAATNQGLAMRILLATAAIIFAVTAAEAQSAGPSNDDQAVKALVEKLKATRAVKSEPTATTTAPVEAKPLQTAPAEAKPVETKPAETTPAMIEAKPVETKATETKPVEANKVETKKVETKPVEAKPVEAKPAQTEKKRVVKSRETHEQTARRLAEKYGVGGLDLE